MAKYHTLIERTPAYGWVIGFGDKDLECVKFEKQDMRDSGVKAKDLRIVTQDCRPSFAQYEALKAIVADMNKALYAPINSAVAAFCEAEGI